MRYLQNFRRTSILTLIAMGRFSPKVVRAARLFASFMLGSGVSSLVAFVAMPVYTRLLAPDSYGYFDVATTVGTIAAALLYADVWVGVMRLSMRDSDLNRWVKPGVGLFAISSVALALVAAVTSIILHPEHVWLVYGAVVAKAGASFWGFVSRGANMVRLFALSGVVNAVGTFLVSVIGLRSTGLEAGALFLGVICGSMFQVILIELRLRVFYRAFASAGSFWSSELLRFTLPLGLNSVAFWVFSSAGRISVASEMGLFENGIYAAASKLGGLVTVVSGVVTLVWQQLSFERGSRGSEFYVKATALAAMIYGIGGALVSPLGVLFYEGTVDERYLDGWTTVPGFILVAVLAGYSNFVGNIFYALERTSQLFVSTIVCLIVVVMTTQPFVVAFGINGANLALILGYAANIGVRHIILRSSYSVSIPVINIGIAFIGVLAAGFVVVVVGPLFGMLTGVIFSAGFGWWTLRRGGLQGAIVLR